MQEIGPLTNGNAETNDKEKSLREREWEKNKPPWVDELKSNLKSTKITPADRQDKKAPSPGKKAFISVSHENELPPEKFIISLLFLGPNKPIQSPPDLSSSTNHSTTTASVEVLKSSSSSVTVRQQSSSSVATRAQSMFAESGSKVSELSSRFSSVDKSKSVVSASPPKAAEHSKNLNSGTEQSNEDYVQVSKKEFLELKSKVSYTLSINQRRHLQARLLIIFDPEFFLENFLLFYPHKLRIN